MFRFDWEMKQARFNAGRRARSGPCVLRQGSSGVGNIISNVLKKRNGISRRAPRLLCTLEPGDRTEPVQLRPDCYSVRFCLRGGSAVVLSVQNNMSLLVVVASWGLFIHCGSEIMAIVYKAFHSCDSPSTLC